MAGREDRKRRRFFAMAVWLVLVAGIQWEDRFYSGLNPVMPARASRFHGRASSRTPPFISISTLAEDEVKLLKKKKKKCVAR